MLKFWEKTKNTVTLGINQIQEATGNQTIQEDAAYLDTYNAIKESNAKLASIKSTAKDFAKYIEKMTTAQYTLSGQIAALFKSDDSHFSVAKSAHQAQEAVFTNSRNLAGCYLESQILNKVADLQKELDEILKINDKRKKNHILLNDAQKDLEKAKSKGKVKDIGELQEKVAKRQAKFAQYDGQFNTLAGQYLSKAPAAYGEIFDAFQFYIAQFYEEGKKQAIDVVPDFKYSNQLGKYPSITVLPPIEQTKPTTQ